MAEIAHEHTDRGIGGLPTDSHAFQLIELLARRSPASAEDVVAKIAPGRSDGTTAAR
jgi:hypothetical protein